MISSWICFRCQATIEGGGTCCLTCGSPGQPAPEPAELPPPEPGLLAGLLAWIEAVSTGALTGQDFLERLGRASENLDQVFADMNAEIRSLPDQDTGYGERVESGLEEARRLFQVALAELGGYGGTADPSCLRVGLLVAEKAEERYLSLQQEIQADATGHPFGGASDPIQKLGAEVLEARMPLEQFHVAVDHLEGEVNDWIAVAREHLESAFTSSRRFDGRDPRRLEESGTRLARASEALGRVILAIHDPSETVQAARALLDPGR